MMMVSCNETSMFYGGQWVDTLSCPFPNDILYGNLNDCLDVLYFFYI